VAELDLASWFVDESAESQKTGVDRANWTLAETRMTHKFLLYSRYVFLELNHMLVIGGLDDTH